MFLLIYRRKSKTDGNVFLWYLLLYGIERAFVEGLRTDSLYIGGVVRVSQLLSVVLVIFAAVMLIVRKRRAVFNAGEVDPRLVMVRHETDEDPESAEEAATAEAAEGAELAEDAATAENAEDANDAEEAKDAEKRRGRCGRRGVQRRRRGRGNRGKEGKGVLRCAQSDDDDGPV